MSTMQQTPRDNATQEPRSRRSLKLLAAVVAVFAGLGVAAAWWFLSGDAPAEVDITSAVDQVETDPEPATEGGVAADGVWNVDTSVGDFSITESTGAFVGVRVQEELANIGQSTAVVRTPAVAGTIELDGTTLTAATIEADFTALVSDEPRRETAVHRALNTATYPAATFELTEPVELSALPGEDEPVEAVATGTLTIAGQTNTVQVPLEVAMSGDIAVVTGSFDVTFADYGVQVPTAPVVVSAEDHGTVELQLFLTSQ